MSNCLKKSLTAVQNFSKYVQLRRISQSICSRNVAVPQPDGEAKVFSPKIEEIAKTISQLNLIEVAELSDLLKKKLNLPDAPVMNFANMGPAPAAAKEEEVREEAQTSFTVKIKSYDEKQKVALIKEVKTQLEGMNLVQAKKFIESVPIVVKQDIGKDEAERLKEILSKVGAEIEIS